MFAHTHTQTHTDTHRLAAAGTVGSYTAQLIIVN